MAIRRISVALIGDYSDGREVGAEDFLTPLQISNSDPVVCTESNRGPWANGVIEFVDMEIELFLSDPDPYDSLEKSMYRKFEIIADWLSKRTENLRELVGSGLNLRIFIDMFIQDDQLDLIIAPSLLLACGQLGIPVQLITND